MRLDTSEALTERKTIPSHFSELCVAAVDPIGRGDLQPSTDAGLAPQLVSILDPALGFFQGQTIGSIGGSEGSGVDDRRRSRMNIGSFGATRIPHLLLAILPPLMSNDYVDYTLAIRNDEPLIQ